MDDYRPIPPKSIPDRQKSGDPSDRVAITTLAIAAPAWALLVLFGLLDIAGGILLGCALALAVDRFVRWRGEPHR